MKILMYSTMCLCLLVALSCRNDDVINNFHLDFNQEVSFEDGNFTIEFVETNDSRCPSNAICSWAGSAIVEFKISEDGTNTFFSLEIAAGTVDMESLPTRSYKDFEIKLIEVSPYPINDFNSIPDSDYEVLISISEL